MNMSQTKFKKFLLNRVTVSTTLTDYLENCLATDDTSSKYNFHKIMLHNWADDEVNLYEALSGYFAASFIPVNFVSQNGITTFYTSSLGFILKIIKLDFLFPYMRNMCNIDILLNDKSSEELFDSQVSIEDVVGIVITSRFGGNLELNLSNFCNDKEFIDKKIHFYKLSLLAQFKILMLRIGKDTKYLNLSHNNLSQVPLEILNFFIKGDLLGVNLSNNNIPSVVELQRVSSKIEKLWVEGNPLCDDMDPIDYIKQMSVKFPRLTELDGIRINNNGVMMPFYRTYLDTPNKKTKMLIEKFVTLYFSHFDSPIRTKLDMFYETNAVLSITTYFPDKQDRHLPKIANFNRSLLDPHKREASSLRHRHKLYKSRSSIITVFNQLPATIHDRTTFTIDVLQHDKQNLVLVIDGVYKETGTEMTDKKFNFRRTFIFKNCISNNLSVYHINQEMFSVMFASDEVAKNSFQMPVRHENQLSLIEPDADERDVICRAFTHYTQLRRSEVETRLKEQDWDIKVALKQFCKDLNENLIPEDKFIADDDLSDISLDDEVD